MRGWRRSSPSCPARWRLAAVVLGDQGQESGGLCVTTMVVSPPPRRRQGCSASYWSWAVGVTAGSCGALVEDPVGFLNLAIGSELRLHGLPSGLSCSPFVLVDQSAQNLPPPYSCHCHVRDRGRGDVVAVWRSQVPGPMRAMVVLVHDVFVQYRPQVPGPGNQHPVSDLGPGCPHPPFGISNLSPQGFHRSSQLGLRVTTGA